MNNENFATQELTIEFNLLAAMTTSGMLLAQQPGLDSTMFSFKLMDQYTRQGCIKAPTFEDQEKSDSTFMYTLTLAEILTVAKQIRSNLTDGTADEIEATQWLVPFWKDAFNSASRITGGKQYAFDGIN
tara:strand:- start:3468 stop:3854 length:387 start_codon:yes stop_codon:yes gene_type:complete